MAATIQRISTTDCCWGSKEPWRKRSCTFYARASSAVSSTKQKKVSCDFHSPSVSATTTKGVSSSIPMKKYEDDTPLVVVAETDRKSTRLNSSHVAISYAVFCLKKKKKKK